MVLAGASRTHVMYLMDISKRHYCDTHKNQKGGKGAFGFLEDVPFIYSNFSVKVLEQR
jgi:hypothetical protein